MPIVSTLPVINAAQHATKQDAIDAAHSAGGGIVLLPARTIDEPLTIYDNVHLRGQGTDGTILKLANGSAAGAHVIQTENYATLATGSTTGGPARWSISDLTIDGNKANNASGGSGLTIYGRNFRLRDLQIQNCKTDGITSKWATASGSLVSSESMEASIVGLRVHHNDRHNINWDGPHDSQFTNVVTYYAGNSADLGNGFNITANAAGCQFVNCHAWGYGQQWAWNIAAPLVVLTGCFGEGGGQVLTGGQLLLASTSTLVMGGAFFAGGAAGARGIVIGSGTSVTGCDIDTLVKDCTGGAVVFNNDGGANRIRVKIDQSTGTVDSGTINSGTFYEPYVRSVAYTNRGQRTTPLVIRDNSTAALAVNDITNGTVLNFRADSGAQRLELMRGTDFRMYSDGFTTETLRIEDGVVRLGPLSGPSIRQGSGTPEGVVSAPVGSLYMRTDGGAGTSLYVKEVGSGSTGWVAK